MDELLERACDVSLSDVERLEAWRAYECNMWFIAFRDKGLPWNWIPVEYFSKIRERNELTPAVKK